MRTQQALAKRQSLACSFCRKPDEAVSKLIAGPGVYICDECIGVCNRILDALPASFPSFDAMTDDQLLSALRPADQAVNAVRQVLQSEVDLLRKRDVSWATIGEALGVSRQAAWERFT